MNVSQRSIMVAAFAMLLPSSSLFAGPSLHARPLPDRRSFFVTNIGYDYRVTKPATVSSRYLTYIGTQQATQPSGRHMVSTELGIMHNLNPRYAVGFSQHLKWGFDNVHAGLSVRGRRWLDQEKSIDVTAGALLWGTNGDQYAYPGFLGTASMNFNDWENVRLTITAQPIRFDSTSPKQTEFGTHLGYQIGGKPGLVTTVASGLAVGVLGMLLAASFN